MPQWWVEFSDELSWLFTNRVSATRYMKVKRMGITELLRRIWLFSANKIKSSESVRNQPTQLIVKINSSLPSFHVSNFKSSKKLWLTFGVSYLVFSHRLMQQKVHCLFSYFVTLYHSLMQLEILLFTSKDCIWDHNMRLYLFTVLERILFVVVLS